MPTTLALVADRWGLVTSGARWLAAGAFMLAWYPPLILASRLVPMRRLHGVARLAFRGTLRLLGLRLRASGLAHVDPARAHLFMGNHVNAFDPFVFVTTVPQWVVAVELERNFSLPVYGRLIRAWGNVPIAREDPARALATLDAVTARARDGESFCLMPEGTRSRDGVLGEYRLGPFRVAIDAGVPIVPFALRGMHRFNRTGSIRLVPGEVEIVYGAPIETTGLGHGDMAALAERVRMATLAALQGDAAGV